MNIRHIFMTIAAVLLTSAVLADSSSVTSKKYVDDFMAGYQNKIPGSGVDKLMIYDDTDGIGAKQIVSSLGDDTSATNIPDVGAVKDALDDKQDTINGTAGYVMTGTGTAGVVDEKPIYGATTNYSDSLVTAESVNAGVINAVNNSLIRVNENGVADSNGTLWQISDYLLAINAKVPYGYTELEYIESDGTQYIDTGFIPNTDYTHKIVFNMLNTGTGGEYLCGTNTTYGRSGNVKAYDSKIVGIYAGTTSAIDISNSGALLQTTTPNTLVMNLKSNAASEVFLNGTDISSGQVVPVTSTSKLYLFHLQALSTGGAHARIYNDKIYQNGSLIRNFVPAKNSSGIVGMYDTVSGTFFTDAAGGNFTAGPTCVSPNLFDKNNLTRIYGYFPSSNSSWTYTEAGYSVRIPCKPNTTYTARYNGAGTQAVLSFASTSSDKVPSDGVSVVSVTQSVRQNSPTSSTPITLTTGANDKWLIVAYNVAEPQNTDMADNLQIEEGSTATTYRPYGENICN